jgi:hypothetical protein
MKIMKKDDDKQIMQKFELRQNRQILAIAAALFFVLFTAVVYKRPDLFGEFSKSTLFGAQAVSIVAFIVYTASNWRCPSCNTYLGSNIHKHICLKCRSRLQ